jgi:cell division protein FtsB
VRASPLAGGASREVDELRAELEAVRARDFPVLNEALVSLKRRLAELRAEVKRLNGLNGALVDAQAAAASARGGPASSGFQASSFPTSGLQQKSGFRASGFQVSANGGPVLDQTRVRFLRVPAALAARGEGERASVRAGELRALVDACLGCFQHRIDAAAAALTWTGEGHREGSGEGHREGSGEGHGEGHREGRGEGRGMGNEDESESEGASRYAAEPSSSAESTVDLEAENQELRQEIDDLVERHKVGGRGLLK